MIDALAPDLVFLDIQLPGISGLEVLRRIRSRPAVIFTTAFDRFAVTAFEPDVCATPYGDRDKGLALWRQAIEAFASDRPAPLMPNWGDAEAYARLGGAYLIAGQPGQAREPLERAVAMRPDFWWAAKAALPMARRPT